MELNPKLRLKHWSVRPRKRGLYVRDWRGTDVLPETDRRLSIDLWMPLPPGDAMGPGMWYVWPDWNDASRAELPWRKATRAEKAAFLRENPGASSEL